MSVNMKYVRKLLGDAKAEGMLFRCYYDEPTEPDYLGDDIQAALDALTACDVMHLNLIKPNPDPEGKPYVRLGWVQIIPDITSHPEEIISDFSGRWVDAWYEANLSVTT